MPYFEFWLALWAALFAPWPRPSAEIIPFPGKSPPEDVYQTDFGEIVHRPGDNPELTFIPFPEKQR